MEGIIIFLSILFVFGVVVATVFIKKAKDDKKTQQRQKQASEKYRTNSSASMSGSKTTMSDEQRRRLEYFREQQKQKTAAEKHEQHVEDAHEHGHTGEEEHYEEIVGSLGEINDEGCVDLSGVRFIAHDLAYESGDGEHQDYTEIAKAIVLGDIVNNPRFKNPHSRK